MFFLVVFAMTSAYYWATSKRWKQTALAASDFYHGPWSRGDRSDCVVAEEIFGSGIVTAVDWGRS